MKNPLLPGLTSRRTFISTGTLTLLAAGSTHAAPKKPLRIGLITDLHYADKKPGGSRHYRESLTKLTEATDALTKAGVDFVVELGDLIDAAKTAEEEMTWLKQIHAQFEKMPGQRHCVLGNHCVATLSKEEFLQGVGQKESYYSFDASGIHFVVLDACFKEDETPYDRGNFHWQNCAIPKGEREWLRKDLAETKLPTIILAHQRIDETKGHSIKNHAHVREILEGSGKVLAVFQGHSHKNEHVEVNGIQYCTLVAMVEGAGAENNGYSIVNITPNGSITVEGFRKQADYTWPSA